MRYIDAISQFYQVGIHKHFILNKKISRLEKVVNFDTFDLITKGA